MRVRTTVLPCTLGFVACLAVMLTGCGGPSRPAVTPAKGKVLINGEPLTGHLGFVRVEPSDSRAATGEINQTDGTFTLSSFVEGDGCVPGTHAVAVIVNTTMGAELISLIPEHYSDATTSGLTVTVGTEPADLTIELSGQLKAAQGPTAEELEGDDPGF